MHYRHFLLLPIALLALPFSGNAQETSGDFSGGSVTVGYDNRACAAGIAGSIRYTSTKTASTTGLVGHWKLDETSGTNVVDSSASGNDGTWSGSAAVSSVDGIVGTALDFDGSNDIVNLGNPTELQITGDFTVAAWVKFDAFTSGGFDDDIFSKSASGSNVAWQLKATEDCGSTTFSLLISSSGGFGGGTYGQRCSSMSPGTGTWYHVVGVFDAGTSQNIYVNGALNNGTLQGSVQSSMYNSTQDAGIGSRSVTGSDLNGQADDVRIYDRALSASDVTELYESGRALVEFCDGSNWDPF